MLYDSLLDNSCRPSQQNLVCSNCWTNLDMLNKCLIILNNIRQDLLNQFKVVFVAWCMVAALIGPVFIVYVDAVRDP